MVVAKHNPFLRKRVQMGRDGGITQVAADVIAQIVHMKHQDVWFHLSLSLSLSSVPVNPETGPARPGPPGGCGDTVTAGPLKGDPAIG